MAVDETREQLVARLRAADRASLDAFMKYGFSDEELAEQDREDEAYFAARRAEIARFDRQVEEELAEERIYERMRRHDRAFGG